MAFIVVNVDAFEVQGSPTPEAITDRNQKKESYESEAYDADNAFVVVQNLITGTSRLMLCQRNCVVIAYSCRIITCCWSFRTAEALTHKIVTSCSSNVVTVFHRSWQSDTCSFLPVS